MNQNQMTNTSEITADYTLNTKGLHEALLTLVTERQPTIIWSAPGLGKSAIAAQVAQELGHNYIDVRALLLDPVDLRGIPYRNEENRTVWAPPNFLPPTNSDDKYLINLEELPAAPPMVQAALYQLVQNRTCGEYVLPHGASIIACGNRENDRGLTHKMPTPLARRFIHINLKADSDTWLDWAIKSDIAAEVVFFIKFRPDMLHMFNPTSNEQTFPCPGTWEFVSNIVKRANCSDFTKKALYQGAVGIPASIEFINFLENYHNLPNTEELLKNPEEAAVPENISILLALCASIYNSVTPETYAGMFKYADRLRPEVAEFLISSCTTRNPEIRYTDEWIDWITTK